MRLPTTATELIDHILTPFHDDLRPHVQLEDETLFPMFGARSA